MSRTKSLYDNEAGFALIELLVVVIIVGILAAIAIPTYLAQRQNAYDADATNISHTVATAAFSYRATHGSYTDMDATDLYQADKSLPDPAAANFPAPYSTYDITVVSANDFTIDVKHSQGATTFRSTDAGTTLPLP